MAISVRNQVVTDLLLYLQKQPEGNAEAERLYEELLIDQTEADYESLKAEEKVDIRVTRTKGGSYII